ncbi:hypothetical protein [Bradyrhizobium sp. HKCCYLR20261]|uniref:hypothetical protein n=1 Tax=unclassified Bradyrhizobium TaxID=2631580 RepID=UPI003EBA0E7B
MTGFTSAERLSIYTHLRTFESDFDKSQSQIRSICSAWTAAVLGAIGLITVNAFTPPPAVDITSRAEHLAYLRALVCMIGSAGVFAFWFIDQRVYQRLLHSAFAYGLFLELKHPDLPQLRSSLFIANLDITSGLSWFYRMQFWIMLAISAVFVLQPFSIDLGPVPRGIKTLTEIHLLAVIVGEVTSRTWPSLRKIIQDLYPDLWAVLPARKPPWWREHVWPLPSPDDDEERRARWKQRVASMPAPPAPAVV